MKNSLLSGVVRREGKITYIKGSRESVGERPRVGGAGSLPFSGSLGKLLQPADRERKENR